MFKGIRKAVSEALGALRGIEHALGTLPDRWSQEQAAQLDRIEALVAGMGDRLQELERTRAVWEAEIEAELNRAQSERRTARAAEERARAKLERATAQSDDGDEEELDIEEYRRLLEVNGHPGEGEGMQPVRSGMGNNREEQRALATRFKFMTGG